MAILVGLLSFDMEWIMAEDNYEFIETPDGNTMLLEDRITARVNAYVQLMHTIRNMKEEALIEEGMLMLARLRLSITIQPDTPLSVMKGGKKEPIL
jgi:hypothetical protein